MELLIPWLSFLACAVVIGFAGPHLSRSGDIIAEKTGLPGSWIGLALLATVTSLPELATGMSAVTIAMTPDIAVGDIFGSCVFNLAILVVVDFLQREEPVFRRARQGHILSASFGVVAIGLAGNSLLLASGGLSLAIGHVGLASFIGIGLYLLAMRTVFVYEREHREEFAEAVADRYPDITLRSAIVRYVLSASLVVLAGVLLPFAGKSLSDAMGWSTTFVGSLFVAAATSLPELVVTIAAVRIGALDMAIAGLLGSNLFDMFILAIDDFAFLPGPIAEHVSPAHALSAVSAMVMTGVAIIGLQYRPSSRLRGTVGWTSLALLVVYLLNSYVLYLYGH